MTGTGCYDKAPFVPVCTARDVAAGVDEVAAALRALPGRVVAVEAYPGVRPRDLHAVVDRVGADLVVDVAEALLAPAEVQSLVQPDVTDDPVFGRLTRLRLADFFDADRLELLRAKVAATAGRVVVVGTGATLVGPYDALVYADLARWEAQGRQRRGEAGNLGAGNAGERAALLYKRAFFVDWRVADRHKAALLDRIDAWLDTTCGERPLLVSGDDVRRGLDLTSRRPFRVVPFFDPAPWGGHWMRDVCGLPTEAEGGPPNYGWCFDCVPEENSLLLGFGDRRVELPSLDLVLYRPEQLLGARVRARFGDEFPIRFDFLDTMGGGNLSLQVHPLEGYIRDEFGWSYTQDESYYLLDAEPGAHVYLGLREDVDRRRMLADLQAGADFPAERHVNVLPARPHDHFLIPAGTVHCSGAGSMVLEISATPFIFTFKLWDWGRPGLDGRPRPLNVERGAANIQWGRRASWVAEHLVNRVTPVGCGPGWSAERTGLHEAEFLETHRHWFTGPVPHETGGGVQVLNLVQGEQVTVESPTDAFPPLTVHYAETFIVPASVGSYVVRPSGRSTGRRWATVKAFVRT